MRLRKRKLGRRVEAAEMDDKTRTILGRGRDYFGKITTDDDRRDLWETHREQFLAEWIDQWPGTRPHAWWKYEALQPRQCINGVHPFDDPVRQGIINEVETEHPEYKYAERVNELSYGKPRSILAGSPRDWEAAYETERDYLDRLDLLTTDERLALSEIPDDEDPEAEAEYRRGVAGVRKESIRR